jgi:hypothetical protein
MERLPRKYDDDSASAQLATAVHLLRMKDTESDLLRAYLFSEIALRRSLESGRSFEVERGELDEPAIIADALGPMFWKAA